MRKLKLVKVVIPEIVAFFGNTLETAERDYRCTECGFGVADDYVCCPHCGAELVWSKVKKPSQKFLRLAKKM